MSEVLVADAGFVIARQVQMQIQPELERNPASGQAISASKFLDLTEILVSTRWKVGR